MNDKDDDIKWIIIGTIAIFGITMLSLTAMVIWG